MRRRWLGSRLGRFMLIVLVLQLLGYGGVLLFVWQTSHAAIAASERDRVAEMRQDLMAAYYDGGAPALERAIVQHLKGGAGEHGVMLLTDARGRRVAGNLVGWPEGAAPDGSWRLLRITRPGAPAPEAMGVTTRALPGGYRLLLGSSAGLSQTLTTIIEEALATGLLVGLFLTLLSALLLGRIVAREIGAVVKTAQVVGDGALGERVPIDGSGDAFDALGRAINAMLDRIEALVGQLRLMTDGLAHDFRAPVTRLRVALDRARADVGDPAAHAALETLSVETDRLLAMLSTALLISRTEAGIGREQFQPAAPAPLLADLAEVYGPLAEERGFAIDVEAPPSPPIALHRQLVLQALGNLIENAASYAAGGSRITLSARIVPEGVAFAVADNGPGIAPEDRGRAMSRFGRLDPARAPGGSGLGLSLVEAVARLHGGGFRLEDNAPGLRAVLVIAG